MTKKTCNKCGELKPISQFTKSYKYESGKRYMYYHNCLDCTRRYMCGYGERSGWIERNKARYLELQREAQRRYGKRHPEKLRAHQAAKKIETSNQCEVCG